MKLRITKLASNNQYAIEKRIFHFFKWEIWVRYYKAPISFISIDEAKEKIKEFQEEKIDKKDNKDKEIFRYDI